MVSLAQRKSISISISHGIINKKKKHQKMRSIAGPRGIWESKMYQHPNKNHASSCDLRRHPTPCPCQYIGIENMKQARQKRKRKGKREKKGRRKANHDTSQHEEPQTRSPDLFKYASSSKKRIETKKKKGR